ncbi:MAG: hypothetical protein RBU25_07880 [Lentisphaeria bacterium]|jgi:hypothetical protein|nr:hypothetical protein [Lentisphaeria bacterium]
MLRALSRNSFLLLVLLFGVRAGAQPAELANGGFEDGVANWSWEQWRGRPEPGGLHREDVHEGMACYRLGLPGGEGSRFITSGSILAIPGAAYRFELSLRCQDMPADTALVRILQWGTEKTETIEPQGWIALPGATDGNLVVTGGTQPWRRFEFAIPPARVKLSTVRFTVYIYHSEIGLGDLYADGIVLAPVAGSFTAEQRETAAARVRELSQRQRAPAPVPAAARPPQEGNLLRGDTTFETGVADWPGALPARDAAHGEHCLHLPPGTTRTRTPNQHGTVRAGQVYTLSFAARADSPAELVVDIWHLRYSIMRRQHLQVGTEWQRHTVELPAQDRDQSFYVVFEKPPQAGLWLDAVQFEAGAATPYRPSEPLSIAAVLTPDEPGNLLLTGPEPVRCEIRLHNGQTEARQGQLVVRTFDGEARLLDEQTAPLALPAGGTAAQTLTILPERQAGYRVVQATFADDGSQAGTGCELPLAIVPPPAVAGDDPDSWFGLQGGGVPLEALSRLGVKWLRHFRAWRWLERKPGELDLAALDFDTCRKHGFHLMETIQLTLNPDWAKGEDRPIRDVGEAVRFALALAAAAGPEVRYWEVENEPDLVFPSAAKLSLGDGAAYYAEVTRAISTALRAAHPGVQILGTGVSGGDCGPYPFSRVVFRDAADAFDIWALHPYSPMRKIGPSGISVTPEENRMREKLIEAERLIAAQGGRHRLWVGELGWSLDVREGPLSPSARRHAESTARALILARSLPAVERMFWFITQGCDEGGYEYGLWRDARTPLPAAPAYATAARFLDHARPLGPIFESDIRAYAFQHPGRTVVTLWKCAGDTAELLVDLPAEACTLAAMTGETLAIEARDGRLALPLSTAPVYLAVRDLDPELVRARIAEAGVGIDALTIAVLLSDSTTIQGTLKNNLPRPLAGTLELHLPTGWANPAPRQEFTLDASTAAAFRFAFTPAAESRPEDELLLVATTENGVVRRRLPAAWEHSPAGGLALDTPLQPGQGARPVHVLDDLRHVQPPDAAVVWQTPANLRVLAATGWDDGGFHFLAEVHDDAFHQPHTLGETWKGDSIQLAFDAGNDALEGRMEFDGNDHEFALALTPDGPQVFRHAGPAGTTVGELVSGARLEVRRDGARTRYLGTIPWSELAPLRPVAGRMFGCNFIVNDNDGAGRRYWLGLSPGIGEMKYPYAYRRFLLDRAN